TSSNGASIHQDSPTSGTVSGATVTYTLTTDSSGNATVTFDSPTAGKVTGNASSTLSFGTGDTITRSTGDGYSTTGGSDGANAVKTYQDLIISITPPNATNPVGASHTFTVTVDINKGDGAGFVVDPGATVTVTLTPSNGAVVTQI